MTGPKTNERPGTRAQVKYVRSSAYKAREVLNLVRGKSYAQASEILTFSERRISNTVLKCLDSAVANAENNDHIPAEELYVASCYADEGPTLKRWRPRARGRATRIRKRTCHITVIVARYTPEYLDELREREAARGKSGRSSAAEARRERVAKSRERDEARTAAEEDEQDMESLSDDEQSIAAGDDTATDTEVAEGQADEDDVAEDDAADETVEEEASESTDTAAAEASEEQGDS